MPTAIINNPNDGDVIIANPGPSKAIQFVSWELTVDGATPLSFISGTFLWGTYATQVAGGGVVIPYSPARLLQTPANNTVTIAIDNPVGVYGSIDYNIVDVLT